MFDVEDVHEFVSSQRRAAVTKRKH